MSRHKTDPVERAFDAFIALTDQQRAEYDSMLRGYHRAKQNGTQEPKPRRRKPVGEPSATGRQGHRSPLDAPELLSK